MIKFGHGALNGWHLKAGQGCVLVTTLKKPIFKNLIIMKKFLKNALMNVFLLSLPVLLALVSPNIFVAIPILITVLVSEMLIIKDVQENWSRQTKKPKIIYSLIGIALGVNSLSIAWPPQIAIIISLCLLVIGGIQVCLEPGFESRKILWIDIYNGGDAEFSPLEYIFFLAVALFSVLMIIANFKTQAIWLPIVSCGLIIHAYIKTDLFSFQTDEEAIEVVSDLILILTGIVSTLIQFNKVEIMGIRLWIIISAIIVLLISAFIWWVVKGNNEFKKRQAEEALVYAEKQRKIKEEKKALKESLLQRSKELSLEEIHRGFTEINQSFGAELLLSSEALKIEELITVSNIKKQIFWGSAFQNTCDIMTFIANKESKDENLKKVLSICSSIKKCIQDQKDDHLEFHGEKNLLGLLENVEAKAYRK